MVGDPPVGLTDWGRDGLLLDRRWEFGVPTKAESELAWLQHCYAHTAPGGRVVFVMPPSVAYRRAGKRIRSELLRAGVLRTVVALPSGMVASHAQPVHLWVLQRLADGERPAPVVRMIDLSGADPAGPLEAGPRQVVDVPVIDLLDESVDLTPAAHLSAVRSGTSSSGTYRSDVRGARIPQMDLDEQRRYGAAFRALDEAETLLHELGTLGPDAVTRARDGLTTGTLRP